jgi:hypothetical protein
MGKVVQGLETPVKRGVQHQRPYLSLIRKNKKTINVKSCVYHAMNLGIDLSNAQKNLVK